uniref:Uncharacterized protein n=1 Tax=Poecilia formosa TaxID=48698 RepID=A0A096MCK1_POEFO
EENFYIYRVTSESAALFCPHGRVQVQISLRQKPCRAVFVSGPRPKHRWVSATFVLVTVCVPEEPDVRIKLFVDD